MKIIHVARFGGVEELQLIERPTPAPGPNQILVENRASGLNFADVMARAGTYPGVRSAPFDPGFEVAGVVAGVGEGVSDFQVGDRVMGMLPGGGYATHALLDAPTAVKLPGDLDFAPATALLVQGLTAYFLLEAGGLGAGDTVLIPSAAGGVGSLATQIARLKGAGKVIGLASPRKHDAVRNLGADAVFDYTQPGWGQQVFDATGGKGVDIYLDSQGDLAGEGVQTLGDKARWLIFGFQSGGQGALDLGSLIFRNITLRGYTVYSDMHQVGRALSDMIGWTLGGQLQIEVGNRFALAEAAQAHAAIEARGTSGKVVLEP